MTPSWRRWLAGAAALAGALAAVTGSPYHRAMPGAPDASGSAALAAAPSSTRASFSVDELARAVTAEEDHVSAVELAGWICAHRPGLRVIDVRSEPEYRGYHIPDAEHVPLERLAATRFAADETIVLYSELGVHGAQAWVFLRALGHRRVFFLRNGLHEWLDDVMSPTLAGDASADAEAAFARVAELSRWFGGTPRRLTGAVASDAAPIARRRGC